MAMKPLLYQNDHAGVLSYLVYIGGMEIPSMGFDVSYGVWEIPQAAVRLVPDPILHRLGAEDRIPVQCFYLDQWQHSPPQYCLMFDGEIVAWGYQGTPGGRALTFTCADYAAILTQTFFFLMSTFDDFAIGTSSAGIGVAGNAVQTAGFGALYPYSLFAQGLANEASVRDDRVIERPIDYAYNIVRAMIKLEHENRSIPAANFFAPWTQKTNFHRRWVALPYFDADPVDPRAPGLFPILKAAQDDTAISAIARQASQAANGSLWSMLQEVLRTVMCELSMLPTPAAVKSDYRTLLPAGKPTAPSYGTEPVFLTQYFVKPQSYYSLPPACNVFFPSQIQHSAYQENYATQPTRAYYNEAAISNILSNNAGNTSSGAAAAATLMQDALTTGYPEEVDIAIRDARDAALQNGKNMLVYPEEYFKGPVILRKQLPRWFAYLIDASRSEILVSGTSNDSEATGGAEGVNDVNAQYSETEGGPVYFGGPTNPHGSFLPHLGISEFQWANIEFGGRAANPSERRIIFARSLAVGARPGPCVPPKVFPLRPPSAWKFFDDPNQHSAGHFWDIRNGSIHGGHDLPCPPHAEVVATTDGTVVRIISTTLTRENPAKGRPIPRAGNDKSDETGNCVVIKDSAGGLHRYMHLYTIPDMINNIGDRALVVGATVRAGDMIGYAGSTGRSDGTHLHYDVTDESGKFRMPYAYRLAGLGRHPSASTAPPAPPPAETAGGTPPQSDAANAAQTPANTSANGGVGTTGSQVAAGDTRRNVFKLYAKCDYYTERYAQRNGTLSMPFNPYPIPGFGMAAFDRRSTGLDTVGYLTNVQQSVSAAGWGTTITYSQGRTFQEMFMLMQRDAAMDAARMANDGGDIRHLIQSRYNAAEQRIRVLISDNGHNALTHFDQQFKWERGDAPGLLWISPVEGSHSRGAPAATPGGPAAPAPTSNANGAAATGGISPTGGPAGAQPGAPSTDPDIDDALGGYAATAGDVRMAPAEPLEEIRKLQDIELAASFYSAMFWQNAFASSEADITAADSSNALLEQRDSGTASYGIPAQVQASNGLYDATAAAAAVQAAAQASAESSRTHTANETANLRARLRGATVFRQEDIIRMVVDNLGNGTSGTLDIEHSGSSAPARSTALRLTRKAAYNPGDMSREDIEMLASMADGIPSSDRLDAEALYQCLPRKRYANDTLPVTEGQTWAYVPAPEDQMRLLVFLRSMELYWNTQTVTTNVRGDVALVPTVPAAPLFESYTSAMRYNARPVCSLDEYLLFLGGADGDHEVVPENIITVYPQRSNLGQNDYVHPAKYYKVIRNYTQGPPRDRGDGLLAGAAVGNANVSDPGLPVNPASSPTPAPTPAAAPPPEPNVPPGATPRAFPLAVDDPENAVRGVLQVLDAQTTTRGTGVDAIAREIQGVFQSDADVRRRISAVLASYLVDDNARMRGFNPPISKAEATTIATITRNHLLAENVSPNLAAPFLGGFLRTQTFANALPDTGGERAHSDDIVRAFLASNADIERAALQARSAAQVAADRAADLEAARQVVGTHPIQIQYVAGVSAQFPQTRADWYAVLERYRSNVLTRDDPRS